MNMHPFVLQQPQAHHHLSSSLFSRFTYRHNHSPLRRTYTGSHKRTFSFQTKRISCLASFNSHVVAYTTPVDDHVVELDEAISQVRTSIGLPEEINQNQYLIATGWEDFFGMRGEWTLAFNTGGRGCFFEQFNGKEVRYSNGFDGNQSWQSDSYGRCSYSDYDDKEVSLLGAWVRSGYWLCKGARNKLTVRLAHKSELDKWPDHRLQRKDEVAFAVAVIGGKLEAYVVVEKSNWLPHRMVMIAYGGLEIWQFRDWLRFSPDSNWRFPSTVTRIPKMGDPVVMYTEKVETSSKERVLHLSAMPGLQSSGPANENHSQAVYHDDVSPHLEVLRAESGHLMVKPLLDGKDMGYFILDSGASSMTICKRFADELKMPSFGDFHVIGVEGMMKCQYRRSKSLQLGPLELRNPTFLELESTGIVRGVVGVLGLCGYEIFMNSVVEMQGNRKDTKISLYNPDTYKPSFPGPHIWQDLHLMSYVPFVNVTILEAPMDSPTTLASSLPPFKTSLMLDTGAGGADVLLLSSASEEPIIVRATDIGTGKVKGVGKSNGMSKVRLVSLCEIRVGEFSFKESTALCLPSGIELSTWVSGLISVDLLMTCDVVVFDYSRKKLLLQRKKNESPAQAVNLLSGE